MGEAHIGSYAVETHKGEQFVPSELLGDFGLVYFGTVSHPDTVSELERLAEIINQSGESRIQLLRSGVRVGACTRASS